MEPGDEASIPTVEVVELNNTHSKGQDKIVSKRINLEAYKKDNCLQSLDYLLYEGERETDITMFSLIARKPTEEQVVTAVSVAQFVINGLRSIQSDVIFMHYNFYRFACPQVQHVPAPLQYADHLSCVNVPSSVYRHSLADGDG